MADLAASAAALRAQLASGKQDFLHSLRATAATSELHCAKINISGKIIPFLVLGFLDKARGYAPALCYIAGSFRPLPEFSHCKLKTARFFPQYYSEGQRFIF